MVNITKLSLYCLLIVLVTACSQSRYHLKHDVGPKGSFDVSAIPDVKPIYEPMSRSGNKSPYQVRGKTYYLMDDPAGYSEEGIGSWYGVKFHGYKTSNGETYNMYEFTAAHKTLPLPSYLRVTNLENNKELVVRVNDRGPFHGDRIIDLSYAAAKKLEYDKKGTARLKLEYIDPRVSQREGIDPNNATKLAPDKLAQFVQLGSFSNKDSAQALRDRVAQKTSSNSVFVATAEHLGSEIHRVRVGPFFEEMKAKAMLDQLTRAGLSGAMLITRSLAGKSL